MYVRFVRIFIYIYASYNTCWIHCFLQYNINFEKSRIQSWVENCILEAQDMGVKVIALGLLNKVDNLPLIIHHHALGICLIAPSL